MCLILTFLLTDPSLGKRQGRMGKQIHSLILQMFGEFSVLGIHLFYKIPPPSSTASYFHLGFLVKPMQRIRSNMMLRLTHGLQNQIRVSM